jgi:hypothetical protein
VFRGTCGDYRVLTTNAHGPRVPRAPGVSCSLASSRDKLHAQFGCYPRREIAESRQRPFADGSPPIEIEIPFDRSVCRA